MSPRRPKAPDGLLIQVPLPPDDPGPIVFKFEMNEAQVRALAGGHVLAETQDLCQGLLQWLEEDDRPAPASVVPGSSMHQRKPPKKVEEAAPQAQAQAPCPDDPAQEPPE